MQATMYQLSLLCVDGTTELKTAFVPVRERSEQSEENKILSLRVADFVANDSVRSKKDERRNSRCHSEARQRDASTHMCPLHFSSQQMPLFGNGRLRHLVHALLFGIQ